MSNYQKKLWKRGVSGNTPILAEDLNKYEDYLFMHDQQIENLTHIPEGSTTADLEVIDGRVGYNGEIFNSLGDAIRGQIEDVYDRMGHPIYPKGTISFENLPSFDVVTVGDMYNISNNFTTDSRFVEGSGKKISAGANVYAIDVNGTMKWDLFAPVNNVVIDSALSDTSENPVQNKVVTGNVKDLKAHTHTNLLNPTAQTRTINGVTFTNNGDGTYTANGTAQGGDSICHLTGGNMYIGDIELDATKIYKLLGSQGGSGSTYQITAKGWKTDGTVLWFQDWKNSIITGVVRCTIYIAISNGYTANNILFKPMLTTDLSATYNDYVGYSGDGEVNENVAEIYAAEDALQNEGYKYPIINGIKNYTDNNGVYHKHLGVVDLGTLNWTMNNSHVGGFMVDFPLSKTGRCSMLCGKYPYDSSIVFIWTNFDNLPNKALYRTSGVKSLYIKDTTYTDATDFKNAMSGVLLFYELETPQTWNSRSEISRVSDDTYTNLLNPTAQTRTINGVTFTNNGDGTYTVNGTASGGNIAFNIAIPNNADISENIKLVGCPVGGDSSKYRMYISCYKDSTYIKEYDDYGQGVFVSNIPSEVNSFRLNIAIKDGYTTNNLRFKPMLTTKLDATYNDYIPYSGGGALNENVAEMYKEIQTLKNAITELGGTV